MKQNPHHYATLMRLTGPRVATKIQNDYGAGLYYNTAVEMEGKIFKYGIVTLEKLISDLENWDTLYVAGRLHKPTLELVSNDKVTIAQQKNLLSAVLVSLALLTKRNNTNVVVDKQQIYETITSLSYMGDVRMKVGGENKNKVKNIVSANVKGFDELYTPILTSNSQLITTRGDDHYQLNGNWRDHIPHTLRSENCDMEQTISNIVNRSSTTQSLKGILTAGVTKSISYALAKLQKGRSK
jgi:translocator assembly and maintenance protein 41